MILDFVAVKETMKHTTKNSQNWAVQPKMEGDKLSSRTFEWFEDDFVKMMD